MKRLAMMLAAGSMAVAWGCGGGDDDDDSGDDDATCEAVTFVSVIGMNAPTYLKQPGDYLLPEDPDPDRLTVTYNGDGPIPVLENGMRVYSVEACAGSARIEAHHTLSGALVGTVDWQLVPIEIDDPYPYTEDTVFSDSAVVALGEAGDYSLERVPLGWGPPSDGLWRFHVVNGWISDAMNARLIELNPETLEPRPEAETPWESAVVDNLAPRSTAVVEVEHPRWLDPDDEMVLVGLEFWAESAPETRTTSPLMYPLPIGLDTYGYQGGLGTPPDGTIFMFLIWPQYYMELDSYYFPCRDPLMIQYQEDGACSGAK
jgi:hypothetical protein